jgi:hypothetical protein
MKSIFSILIFVFLILSCGKYEKPFITFKSPENRLTDKLWKVDKIVKENGEESIPNQSFTFKIEGNDSIVTRTVENVTYKGTWNWLPALKGKVDKQRIIINLVTPLNPTNPSIMYDIKVLTSKEMEIVDRASAINAGDRLFFSAK